ncbi:ssDNA binding protein [Colletotrichum tofieldiae]|nr:ssDNA binding protein [Colletotrichum tofieldiae]
MSAAALFRRAVAAPRIARAFSTSPSHNVARITIVGNLADTPEIHPTSTGREILKYAVASNSGPKDNRQTSWFRVTSFEPEGPRRDFLQSLPKGTTPDLKQSWKRSAGMLMCGYRSLVFVEGDASMSTYQDAEGKTRSSLNVVQRNIEVLRRPQTGTNASE